MTITLSKSSDKYGVLLVNLGTPDEPTPSAIRKYLREFLSDTRVVEIPPLIWFFILNGLVLPLRCNKVAKAYESIWMEQGSPLRVIGEEQTKKLKKLLSDNHELDISVELAMTYGAIPIKEKVSKLLSEGCENIVVIPLYPQYSATTTAAVFDKLNLALKAVRNIPEVRFVKEYYQNSLYIKALAQSIKDHQAQHGRSELLIFSFHGLPKVSIEKGDPYYYQCEITAKSTAKLLGLSDDAWKMTFQSRFGKQEWLQPYTDKTLTEIAEQGIKSIQIICPAFSADCLETLEEISIENKDIFLAAGGEKFEYIPALNNRDDHIELLEDLVLRNLNNW